MGAAYPGPRPRPAGGPALGTALALLLLLTAAPARPSSEEFSTLDVLAQEQDDESVIDHLLTRHPEEWRDEWERAPNGMRVAQGCLTSALWTMESGVRARAPLGDRARFELLLDQYEADRAQWNQLELWFRFPQRFGTASVMLRPYADKSRHDLALAWGVGADTTAFHAEAIWGLEDLFNNLWAFRQTQVGGHPEPYRRHPWEPALRAAWRHERWRAEIAGKYLTPSWKDLEPLAPGGPRRDARLWGARGAAAIEVRALGAVWQTRGEDWQAASSERPADLSSGDQRHFRRSWSAELAVRVAPAPRLTAEARGLYVARDAAQTAPLEWRFFGVDRVVLGEARWQATPSLALRLGAIHDRIGVTASGVRAWETQGTRTESRAFFGFVARFGRLRVAAVEGVELDPERYEVNFHHDKSFAQIQTTF